MEREVYHLFLHHYTKTNATIKNSHSQHPADVYNQFAQDMGPSVMSGKNVQLKVLPYYWWAGNAMGLGSSLEVNFDNVGH